MDSKTFVERLVMVHGLISDETKAMRLARVIVADSMNYQTSSVKEAIVKGDRDAIRRLFEDDRLENFNLRVIPEIANSNIFDEAVNFMITRWENQYREFGKLLCAQ